MPPQVYKFAMMLALVGMTMNFLSAAMVLNEHTGGTNWFHGADNGSMNPAFSNQSGAYAAKNNSFISSSDTSDIGMVQKSFNMGGSLIDVLRNTFLLGNQVNKVIGDFVDPRTGENYTHYIGDIVDAGSFLIFALGAFQILTGRLPV